MSDVALDVGDVWRRCGVGARDAGDGGEVDAVDVGGGWVAEAEMVGYGAGAAADVEEAVGVVQGGVDGAVVHEG